MARIEFACLLCLAENGAPVPDARVYGYCYEKHHDEADHFRAWREERFSKRSGKSRVSNDLGLAAIAAAIR